MRRWLTALSHLLCNWLQLFVALGASSASPDCVPVRMLTTEFGHFPQRWGQLSRRVRSIRRETRVRAHSSCPGSGVVGLGALSEGGAVRGPVEPVRHPLLP